MITADPNTLRYGANRFAAAAQEMKRQAIQLEQTTSNVRQGQDGWTGEGAQEFLIRGERLVHDANKASQAFESVANTLSRFAMRMEHVLDLRRRADRLDQQAFEYGDETLDSIHTRQHLRHQAAQLRNQADSEASVADSQASKEFQMIAQMVPSTLIPGADANAILLEGLPKRWQDYYRRHPELLQEEKGAAPMTMGSYKRADYDQIKRRDDAMAALIEYHKLTQSPWLSDEDREEAARVYCEQSYSKLTVDELEKEIDLILKEEARVQKWQDQIQSGVYGEELIEQEGYIGYAFKEYYKDGALAAGMAGVLASMGKLRKAEQLKEHVEVPTLREESGGATYHHLKDYDNNKYFTRSVEFNAGKEGTGYTYKVYQRNDIDWNMVRTTGAKKGRGLTNAEAAAKYGIAPILDDKGSVATLHHSQQKGIGPLIEASTRYHNISNAKRAPLHPYKGSLNPYYPMDETTREKFQKVDSITYWKQRGLNSLEGKE